MQRAPTRSHRFERVACHPQPQDGITKLAQEPPIKPLKHAGVEEGIITGFCDTYTRVIGSGMVTKVSEMNAGPLGKFCSAFKRITDVKFLGVALSTPVEGLEAADFTFDGSGEFLMGTLPSALQRRKVEGMQRWMAFCASAKEVRLALAAWPQRQKPAEVEDLSYEKSPVFASMLRMKASKDAFADFVVAQKEAFALQALSEAELHGCHTTLDFDDMYVAAKTFAEMSKEQFRFLLSADMDLKLELVGELAPSPTLLQNRALLSDQSLQEALMKNPGKPKVAAQARQLSDIKGQLKSFTEQMAWPPETFPITPLTDAIGHTKLSVGVAFVVDK